MIMRHYNKLRERRQHLRDEITRATWKDGGRDGTPVVPRETRREWVNQTGRE
jgi:hypothetical protein